MPENQTPQTPTPSNTTPPQPAVQPEANIDFSKFSISASSEAKQTNPLENKPNLLGRNGPTIPESSEESAQSVIAQLNQIKEEKQIDVQIENINIQERYEGKEEKVSLWSSWIGEKKAQSKALNELQMVMVSYIIFFISVIGIILVSVYGKYLNLASQAQNNGEYSNYINTYRDIARTISRYTNINDYDALSSQNSLLTTADASQNINTIINNSTLNYVQKKDILQNNISAFSNQLLSNANNLDNIKKEVGKYWFLPKELYETIQEQQGIGSIKRSMILMENIKFITAFKVFSYMDSFIQSFASSLNKDPLDVEQKLNEINDEGEKEIITYTNNCYFNPYEIDYDCNIINDFDNYYNLMDSSGKTDTSFIKKLVAYVDMKLQQTDIPTFSINFPNFDPRQDTISFSIDVNTNAQDELALSKQGILNPHLYVVTNLINLLKQSLLVIGENIKADKINISPKTIRVGSTVFTVNTSNITLTLPIQKSIQREISDFFTDNNK